MALRSAGNLQPWGAVWIFRQTLTYWSLIALSGVAELSLIVEPVAPQLGDAQAAQALEWFARRVLIETAQLLVPNPLEGDPGP